MCDEILNFVVKYQLSFLNENYIKPKAIESESKSIFNAKAMGQAKAHILVIDNIWLNSAQMCEAAF